MADFVQDAGERGFAGNKTKLLDFRTAELF